MFLNCLLIEFCRILVNLYWILLIFATILLNFADFVGVGVFGGVWGCFP